MSTHRFFQFCCAVARTSAALACALLWQTSSAQTPALAVTNPAAKVPAVEYRSVFKETSLGVEKSSDNWRKANDEVGKFTRGHVDILKWEEQEEAKAMQGDKAKPAATPSAVPAPAATAPKPDTTKPIAAPAHKH